MAVTLLSIDADKDDGYRFNAITIAADGTKPAQVHSELVDLELLETRAAPRPGLLRPPGASAAHLPIPHERLPEAAAARDARYWRVRRPSSSGDRHGILRCDRHGRLTIPYEQQEAPSSQIPVGPILAISPSGEALVTARGDGTLVLFDAQSKRQRTLVPQSFWSFSMQTFALTSKALYAVSHTPKLGYGHQEALWRLPLDAATDARRVPLPLLGNGRAASRIGDLHTHVGGEDLVAFVAAAPAPGDHPPWQEEEVMSVSGSSARRHSVGPGPHGPAGIAISPQGRRLAFIRSEADGWHQVYVVHELHDQPKSLNTRAVFAPSGGKLHVHALAFVDERHLMLVAGDPATSARSAFWVDLDNQTWSSPSPSQARPFTAWGSAADHLVMGAHLHRQRGGVLLWASLSDGTVGYFSKRGTEPWRPLRGPKLTGGPLAPLPCGPSSHALSLIRLRGDHGEEAIYTHRFTGGSFTGVYESNGKLDELRCALGAPRAILTEVEKNASGTIRTRLVSLELAETQAPGRGKPRELMKHPGKTAQLTLSPDGSWVFFVQDQTLFSLPMDGSSPLRRLYEGSRELIVLGAGPHPATD